MKPGYQKTLSKTDRGAVSREKTDCHSQKRKLNAMEMRNSMNKALKDAKIDLLMATIAKTHKGNNIALTVSEKYTAEALIAHRAT